MQQDFNQMWSQLEQQFDTNPKHRSELQTIVLEEDPNKLQKDLAVFCWRIIKGVSVDKSQREQQLTLMLFRHRFQEVMGKDPYLPDGVDEKAVSATADFLTTKFREVVERFSS